ncbi:MAG: VTT domain-containing protein, partial [Thiogranum sp.]|nr:VTT domain-containing protein [Thiogranum sp.]
AGARPLKPVALPPAAPQVWPRDAPVLLRDVDVAIARTEPAYEDRSEIREVETLYLDAIGAARRFIYIENQYFTARSLGEALGARLEEENGPEVVLVLPQHTGGWLEQHTMDVLRARVIEKLRAADRFDRLRLYYPHQPGLGDGCISVHSKLLIVDDLLLRIGSSNTSSRSMGLDTECDLALAAASDEDATEQAIRDLRQDLLAEHLGVTPQRVAGAEANADGLIDAIESLRGDERSLRTLELAREAAVDELVPDSDIVDPSEPLNPDYFVAEYVPEPGRRQGRRRILLFLALLTGLLALAAAWRWTPMSEWLAPQQMRDWLVTFDSPWTRGLVAVSGFFVASLLMVPLTVLAVLGGLAFGGVLGFTYVMLAALASAALAFVAGHFLSHDAVNRLSGDRLKRLSRRLADRGVLAVAVLRLIPVAPFTVFNLVAGASHVKFRHFLLGSVIGMAPGLGALTLFSDSLWSALRDPSWQSLLGVGLFAAVIVGAVMLMRRWLRSG